MLTYVGVGVTPFRSLVTQPSSIAPDFLICRIVEEIEYDEDHESGTPFGAAPSFATSESHPLCPA